ARDRPAAVHPRALPAARYRAGWPARCRARAGGMPRRDTLERAAQRRHGRCRGLPRLRRATALNQRLVKTTCGCDAKYAATFSMSCSESVAAKPFMIGFLRAPDL